MYQSQLICWREIDSKRLFVVDELQIADFKLPDNAPFGLLLVDTGPLTQRI